MTIRTESVTAAFAIAKERYAALGVDVDEAMNRLTAVPISLHCWQGDDVGGFENVTKEIGGGLAVTGNYPGKAQTADQLRSDLQAALSMIPGRHRVNLHASYAETHGQPVERNNLTSEHFQGWIDWASDQQLGLDTQCSGKADSLPLAARELMRVAIALVDGELDQGEQLVDATIQLLGRAQAM